MDAAQGPVRDVDGALSVTFSPVSRETVHAGHGAQVITPGMAPSDHAGRDARVIAPDITPR
ncbi:hypothetical protein [Streptomyces sp. NPDC088915]|uniref:hypothetical protein n=1 Tax=Streptomyces sp. NPDC088915 TaxID=3365912 RepID=UPI003829F386